MINNLNIGIQFNVIILIYFHLFFYVQQIRIWIEKYLHLGPNEMFVFTSLQTFASFSRLPCNTLKIKHNFKLVSTLMFACHKTYGLLSVSAYRSRSNAVLPVECSDCALKMRENCRCVKCCREQSGANVDYDRYDHQYSLKRAFCESSAAFYLGVQFRCWCSPSSVVRWNSLWSNIRLPVENTL